MKPSKPLLSRNKPVVSTKSRRNSPHQRRDLPGFFLVSPKTLSKTSVNHETPTSQMKPNPRLLQPRVSNKKSCRYVIRPRPVYLFSRQDRFELAAERDDASDKVAADSNGSDQGAFKDKSCSTGSGNFDEFVLVYPKTGNGRSGSGSKTLRPRSSTMIGPAVGPRQPSPFSTISMHRTKALNHLDSPTCLDSPATVGYAWEDSGNPLHPPPLNRTTKSSPTLNDIFPSSEIRLPRF
ncbi:hypothetical protein ACA910_019957 [Epithemia clementina (nom. ined.)]